MAALLAVLVGVAFPAIILGQATFFYRDFGVFGYPLAYYHRECFWHGEIPLWNPYNNCGLPFLAQWNTLVLYPPTLIYLLLPLAWSLGLFCLIHLFWGGWGMYPLGPGLDRPFLGRSHRRGGFFLLGSDGEQSDVAVHHCGSGVDALGGELGRTGVARWR